MGAQGSMLGSALFTRQLSGAPHKDGRWACTAPTRDATWQGWLRWCEQRRAKRARHKEGPTVSGPSKQGWWAADEYVWVFYDTRVFTATRVPEADSFESSMQEVP